LLKLPRGRTCLARFAAFWPLAVLCAATVPPAAGAPVPAPATPPRGCGLQEFWMVNTRFAPKSRQLERGIERIRYSRRVANGTFAARTRDDFLAGVDRSLPTLFLVHGNALDHGQAITNADLLAEAIGPHVPAYRLVLWSWPTEHIRGMRVAENVRLKAGWSEAQGYYLAWLIDRIDPRVPLSLAGHSLGARTVTAALTGLACGQVAGQTLPARLHPGPRPMQVALIAPAMDGTMLLPGGPYGQALAQVDRMLITVNPRDRTLRRFVRMTSARASLLGMTGLPRKSELGVQQSKVRETVLTPWLGGAHVWRRYMNSPEVMARLLPYLLCHDVAMAPVVTVIADPSTAVKRVPTSVQERRFGRGRQIPRRRARRSSGMHGDP